jgi:putative transcriptional regulator
VVTFQWKLHCLRKQKRQPARLLAALHDTATDLHKAGFMDLASLREYDALCLADEVFKADDIVTQLP